jgi:transcriptional regulator with XRE-family HTH domain
MRHRSGLNLEQAAVAAGMSRATVGRYEKRDGGAVKWVWVEALCRAYKVPATKRRELVELARSVKLRGWWDDAEIPDRITPLYMLENEAAAEWHWANTYVPGILQTRDYATAVHAAAEPDRSPGEIARSVDARMKRQEVLTRPKPLSLAVVMDEAVVRRTVGGPAVLAAQLRHLLDRVGDLLDLRVLPFDSGAHAADTAGFVVVRGPEESLDVVHMSNATGALYLEKPAELDHHRLAFQRLQHQALGQEATLALLTETADRYASHTPEESV